MLTPRCMVSISRPSYRASFTGLQFELAVRIHIPLLHGMPAITGESMFLL